MRHVILIFIFFPTLLYGQTARFYADTTLAYRDAGKNLEQRQRLMEMEWKIKGQILHFGSEPIEIGVNKSTIDTLFYKQESRAQWDTIIFKVKESKTYKFIFNTCCGGFDVADENGKHIVGQVIFKVKGQNKNRVYLGTLGETGLIVKKLSDILTPACRSAMSPNKGLQYSLGNNLVRIEKKVKWMQKLGYVNLERLTQLEFVNLVSYQLLSLWDDVLLYQPNICIANAGKPLKRLYIDWSNPNYIENLIAKDSRKFKYERMKFKGLMNESKKQSNHAIIENCIVEKLIEYESEILKTCTKIRAS